MWKINLINLKNYEFSLLVISTYREPIPGWIDNLYGPTGLFIAASSGFLRSICVNESIIVNVVPADLVTNALIASAWDAANIRYIYHCFYRRISIKRKLVSMLENATR